MKPEGIIGRKALKEEDDFQGSHSGPSKITQPLVGITDCEKVYHAELRDPTARALQKIATR